jgi:hypothetical protein
MLKKDRASPDRFILKEGQGYLEHEGKQKKKN